MDECCNWETDSGRVNGERMIWLRVVVVVDVKRFSTRRIHCPMYNLIILQDIRKDQNKRIY